MIGTPAGFKAYAGARGFTAIAAATDAAVSPALQRASDYITYKYVVRFKAGYTSGSPLVPEATYEAAILEFSKSGFWNTVYTPGERKVLVGVGDTISWDVVGGGGGGTGAAAPVSPLIENMLRPYIGVKYPAVFVV